MRILAFSDLHCNARFIQAVIDHSAQADVVVAAGDFAIRENGLQQVISYLSQIKIPTILVPGNHEDTGTLRALCATWQQAIVLHGESVTIDGISFFGLGYEITDAPTPDWSKTMGEAEAAAILDSCPQTGILVTHTPPYGVADRQLSGAHEGSKAVRQALEKRDLKLHLCGHIHHAWDTKGQIGNCLVQNLGPHAKWFTL